VPAAGAVIGLVTVFGTIAVHGGEGFRAEMAKVSCLFTDEIALVPIERLWRSLRRRFHRAADAGLNDQIPSRICALKPVASRYEVPLVSLQSAVSLGLLGELGVKQDAIAELEKWLKPSRTTRHGPGRIGLTR
jgi:type VI protein secretion system component VasF